MFSANIFGDTFSIDAVSQSKKITSSKKKRKKASEDNMTLTVNKCIKLKSKLQLKCFVFLKSVIYLGISTSV